MKISIGQITVTPDKITNIESIGSAVEAASKTGAPRFANKTQVSPTGASELAGSSGRQFT